MSSESEELLEDADELREKLIGSMPGYSIKAAEIALASVITEIALINQWDIEDIQDYFRIIWKNIKKLQEKGEN